MSNAMKLPAALWVLAFVLAASGASAQVTDEMRHSCLQIGDPGGIAACTAIIDADQNADAGTRSDDYVHRALQYQFGNANDQALADYRTALQIDPDNYVAQNGIDDLTH